MFKFLTKCQFCRSFFSASLTTPGWGESHLVRSVFYFSHESKYSRSLGFNLQFPNDKWWWIFFMVLFKIHISSLAKCLFKHFAHFLVLFFYWILRTVYIFWLLVLYQMSHLQIFSPKLWLVSSFSWQYFLKGRSFNFGETEIIALFIGRLCVCSCFKEIFG